MTNVHLHDLNLCDGYYPPVARAVFPRYATTGAPVAPREVAAFYHQGFYVFVR